jgi:Rrf2 family protein
MALLSLSEKKVTPLKEIAFSQGVPQLFLEQLFVTLRKGGFVRSVRGPRGGYILDRPAAFISIGMVMEAVGETFNFTRCEGQKSGCMPNKARCTTHHLWVCLEEKVAVYLRSITLQDVLNDENRPKQGSLAHAFSSTPALHSSEGGIQ